MSTLACNNVAYAYEKGNGILTNISFCFESGKMYAILGPSGSGKTTLLSLLGGLDTPTKGNIYVNNRIPTKERRKNNREIGVVTGNRSLLFWDVPVIESFNLLQKNV